MKFEIRLRRFDLSEGEQLIAKIKKLDIDKGCVVSGAGFTATAEAEANCNGIELRTIAEVEHPDWWLTSAILFDHRQVELLHFQVNFRPEELAHVTRFVGRRRCNRLGTCLRER